MALSVKLQKKVNGFSLDVKWEMGDELAVIFGPSGSGKSMTLQLLRVFYSRTTARYDWTVAFFSTAGNASGFHRSSEASAMCFRTWPCSPT